MIKADKVAFGTLVTLFDKEQNKEVEYNILGPAESELFKDMLVVTHNSPIGQLLISKKIGDTITDAKPFIIIIVYTN